MGLRGFWIECGMDTEKLLGWDAVLRVLLLGAPFKVAKNLKNRENCEFSTDFLEKNWKLREGCGHFVLKLADSELKSYKFPNCTRRWTFKNQDLIFSEQYAASYYSKRFTELNLLV